MLKRGLCYFLLVAVTLVAVGCGVKPAAQAPSPAPPVETEQPEHPEPDPAPTQVAVYFSDTQAQYLIPEWREVPGVDLPTEALTALLAGPAEGRGLLRPLPASVELLRPVQVLDGVATVDLNAAFTEIQGSAGSTIAIESIVFTLTDLPGIQQVQLLVEGSAAAEVHGTSLQRAFSRGEIHTYPVFVDPARVQHLQQAADEGKEVWRLDARRVLELEGRMFGFTAAELEAATLEGGQARVQRGEQTYTITLEQHATKGEQGVWTITGIES